MAVKTITIDLEAYALLSRHKREGQSFSQVIKAHFGPQPTAGRFLERLKRAGTSASEDALDRIEEVVRARVHDRARAIRL